MTKTSRLAITLLQDAAVREYRTAYATNDFNRLLFAIVGLSDVGLDEGRATELIMRGYDVEEGTP